MYIVIINVLILINTLRVTGMYFDLDEFKGFYKISRDGVVVSVPRNGTVNVEKEIKPTVGTNGYLKVSFRCFGKRYTRNIHRLIALTFIENPNKYPCVNHIDGNKMNNDISNLEWTTYSKNIQHAYDNGLTIPTKGEDRSNLTNDNVLRIVEMKESGSTLRNIAKEFNISASTVSDIVLGRTWSHLTGIKFNPNKFRGRKSPTGEKGIIPSKNGKFDVFSFSNGKNHYLIRLGDFDKAKEAKNKADDLLASGSEIKEVVEELRKIFVINNQ